MLYTRCALAECRRRDPKGLYAAAQADPENRLPGVGVPYEEPLDADMVVDTGLPVGRVGLDLVLDRLL